jgi:hypothetical protein
MFKLETINHSLRPESLNQHSNGSVIPAMMELHFPWEWPSLVYGLLIVGAVPFEMDKFL